MIGNKGLHTTRGLASGGALSRGTLLRNLEVRLPSEPLRNPARRQAPDTLGVSGRQCSGQRRKIMKKNVIIL